jgi:HD-GYP domain-containing protein (c-di-GMP phosphodiesterase class II)
MLFVLPLRFVPLCVAAALVLRTPKDLLRGRRTVNELFVRLLSSWHAIGPVLVLVAAHAVRPRWGEWPVMAGALGAQFVFDYATSTGREWLAFGTPPWSRLGFMGWVYLVDCALTPIAFALAFVTVVHPWALAVVFPLVALLAVFARERRSRIDHALELGEAYRGTAFLLGDVVEADDAYTGSHSRDVVFLAVAVADRLELGMRERRQTELVALLHDVGKIRVPPEIINKPGPLTMEERAVINQHTIVGEQMLERVGGLLRDVGRLVRSCHEHYDGSGYPDGLAGEAIPQVARIVCCCDAFSAMTTDRPYRSAMTLSAAINELKRCAGTQFDPAVVAALIDTLAASQPSRD